MPRVRLAVLLLTLAVAARPAVAQRAATVAFLPFEDGGSLGQDREEFAGLRLAIPALVSGELERMGVSVVDRTAVRATFGSARQRGRVDAATAAKVGGEVKATHVVFGGFVDFYGKLRVNARIVDVATGEIIGLVSNDVQLRDRARIAEVCAQVAQQIAKIIGAQATPQGPRQLPMPAVVLLGRGLVEEDAGRAAKAAEFYQQALGAAPELTEAKAQLGKVRP